MNAWNSDTITNPQLAGTAVVSTDNISKNFRITAGGATLMRIDVLGPACKLQTSSDGGVTWVDGPSSATISAGFETITVEPGDASVPLRNLGRVVATAGATLTSVNLMQEN